MANNDWTFLDATISSLEALNLEFNNEQVEDFEQVKGQMLPVRDDQVSLYNHLIYFNISLFSGREQCWWLCV